MNRITIVQSIFAARSGFSTYLEIGVEKGNCLFRVNAKMRIGVDPELRIPPARRVGGRILDLIGGRETALFQMTSDRFFAGHADVFSRHPIDVAFVDGLHTHEQSLKDVRNCLRYLSDGGLILVHDCNPPDEAAALPAASIDRARELLSSGWKRDWCGDVWKTIAKLRSTAEDLRIFVLDCDFGVGVIARGVPENMLKCPPAEVDRMTYGDLESNRSEILNLKPPEHLSYFLKGL